MRRFVVTSRDAIPEQPDEFVSLAYVYKDARTTVHLRREFIPALTPAGKPVEQRSVLVVELASRAPDIEVPLGTDAAVAVFKESRARLFFSRFRVRDAGVLWDIDVLHVENDGLALATCDRIPKRWPAWIGTDVTQDPRFTYEALARAPWRGWPDAADPFGAVLPASDPE